MKLYLQNMNVSTYRQIPAGYALLLCAENKLEVMIVLIIPAGYALLLCTENKLEVLIVLIRYLFVGNVLLLKNQLNLSPDISEVSQEKLLSLVADRLIDSNSNVKVNNLSLWFLESSFFMCFVLW